VPVNVVPTNRIAVRQCGLRRTARVSHIGDTDADRLGQQNDLLTRARQDQIDEADAQERGSARFDHGSPMAGAWTTVGARPGQLSDGFGPIAPLRLLTDLLFCPEAGVGAAIGLMISSR
jgi:hypothetical protein